MNPAKGKLFVLRTGRTVWDEQDRFESASGAPLSEAGLEIAAQAVREIASRDIAAVFSGDREAERQTAITAATILGLKAQVRRDLCQVDYGLWQGLSLKEMQRRQPKVYRRWMESPAGVSPPDGETLDEASSRLRKALRSILKRNSGQAVLVVLSPIMMSLLRCLWCGDSADLVWRHMDGQSAWASFDLEEMTL